MIIVTGASGFIGSCLVRGLNDLGIRDIMVVDDFYKHHKEINLDKKRVREWVHRSIFLELFEKMAGNIEFVYHLGARTDTVEQNASIFDELNVAYSKAIWNICTEHQIPLVYASSAATYGNGDFGYDDKKSIKKLKPLNPYGQSKQDFDLWVEKQKETPPKWAGLKFFNVYGPNEYHKGRMASVIFHAYKQIRKTGKLKLFRSHKEGVKDGHQSRDFVYVKDLVKACLFFRDHDAPSGLYNIGTGKARTFLDLGKATFAAMGVEPDIEFIDTPEDIRGNYQYFTEAKMKKLSAAGYEESWTSLEDGAREYVEAYLIGGRKYY